MTDEQCRAVVAPIKDMLSVLTSKKDAVSLQMKHTVLSAVCILDDNGNIQNRSVLKHLNPTIDARLFKKIVALKHAFNGSESLVLFDQNVANKGGTRSQFSIVIYKSIFRHP